MSYNGYANWETWNVALWLSNNEGLYLAVQGSRPKSADDLARSVMGDLLPNGTPDFDSPADYLKVNWDEVLDAVTEEEEEETTP